MLPRNDLPQWSIFSSDHLEDFTESMNIAVKEKLWEAKRAIAFIFPPAKPSSPGGPLGPGGPRGPQGSHSWESAEDLTSATSNRTNKAKIQKPEAEEKWMKFQIVWKMDQPLLKRLCYKCCQVTVHSSKKLTLFWSLVPWNATCINAVTHTDKIRRHFELRCFQVKHSKIRENQLTHPIWNPCCFFNLMQTPEFLSHGLRASCHLFSSDL